MVNSSGKTMESVGGREERAESDRKAKTMELSNPFVIITRVGDYAVLTWQPQCPSERQQQYATAVYMGEHVVMRRPCPTQGDARWCHRSMVQEVATWRRNQYIEDGDR